ncbi:MAG TPA: hypothetical protein VGW38_29485, partial [Chloroflexota bacterium]|nr:hypothetical protein [Chloroflexota bacterium]
MYLGLFGALQVWWEITQPEALLGWFAWRGDEPVDFWWVVVLNGFALYWLVRGELTAARAARLLFLVLITWLLRQTDFIENPFDPVAGLTGFTGAGFIAFGLLWDALTAGSWANVETPGLPRVSRIFLYLGYVLLTVTLVNWAVTTHNLGEVERFTGEGALVGLARFGRPLLYGVFALTLALPAHQEEGTEEPYVTPAGGA